MADTPGASSQTYFAAAPKAEVGKRVFDKLQASVKADSEREALWGAAYSHYYPAFDDGTGSSSSVGRAGRQGEQALVKVARARRLAQAVIGIIVGANPDWDPKAVNRSSTSRAAVTLGRNILDWLWQMKGLDEHTYTWAEQAFVASEAFLFPEWDPTLGDDVGEEEGGGLVPEGDVVFHNILPWDVARDPTAKSFAACPWLGVKLWRNKWDLAARFTMDIESQDARERILSVHTDDAAVKASGVSSDFMRDSDFIPVWYFFHKKSPVLPIGRELVCVSPSCVLVDKPLSYDGIPVVRLTMSDQMDTPFGYTPFFDALGPQELLDGMDSSIATNFLTLAVQALAVGQGTKTSALRLLGLETVEIPKGESFVPQGINMVKNPPDYQKYEDAKAKEQQQIFGLNDVYMGSPDTAQMNAQAFALLSSMAVQANSPGQRKFLAAVGRAGTSVLRTFQKNVKRERLIPLLGKGDKHLISEASFKGDDLQGIDQVFVKAGNALEQTLPGRMQLLQTYVSLGFVTQPEQVQQVFETGRLDAATHVTRDELLLVEYENEMVLQGINPPVHAFHNHLMHGREHAAPLLNPQGLADPAVIKACQEHFEAHYIEYFGLPAPMDPMTGQPQTDPATGQPAKPDPKADPQWPVRSRMLLGQTPPPMAPVPVGPPGAEGGGPPPPGGLDGQPGAEGAPPGGPGQPGNVAGVAMPQPPPNPLTGNGPAGAPQGVAA